MSDWGFAQTDTAQQLAKVHHFSILKMQDGQEIEFGITVKEFHTPRDPAQPFFAQTDKQTNQKVAPYTPTGWGQTVYEALSRCVKEINRFPYQG
jgi:aryl-phospho-beta-D-glucosidase BglC (GH1 family)